MATAHHCALVIWLGDEFVWSGFILELDEDLFDIDADKLCEDELRSSCNTRKTKDKRDRRHTAGILISCKPCGIIPHVDELFGSESIKQVHGSITEFLGTVKSETRKFL